MGMSPDSPAFDIGDLRAVKAIEDLGSVTAAAEYLGISQPALSQSLRRLERRLGVPLVERMGRRLRLTDAGRVLARHAPAASAALDAATEEIGQLRGLASARVRLIGFPSASPTVVPPLLAVLGERTPGLSLTYVEAEPPEAVAAIRQGEADIALTFSYPQDREDPHRESAAGLSVTAVGADELVLVLPARHPLAEAADVGMADLAEEQWIAGCPRCRGHLMELCRAAGFTPRIGFETDSFLAVEALVAQGSGVATLPRMALRSAPLPEGIVTRPITGGRHRTLHLVTARGAERVPAIAATMAGIIEVVPAV
jgi:DNA-binding transcriptional LysR family regulator